MGDALDRPAAREAKLAGRRLLVVGASSGIGRAIGIAASSHGAAVAFAARRIELLRSAVTEAGPGCVAIEGDVRDPTSCHDMVAAAARALAGLDAVVYAPAVLPLGALSDTSAATWQQLWATNVTGAALVVTAALPHLQASRGRVVCLSSDSVDRPRPGLVGYSASKAALDTLLQGWRLEHPELVFSRVVLGPTDTGLPPGWDPEATAAWLQRWVAEGHGAGQSGLMAPQDVADQVVQVLASPLRVDDISLQPLAARPQAAPADQG